MNLTTRVTYDLTAYEPQAVSALALVKAVSALRGAEFREKVLAIEAAAKEKPQLELEPVHRFAPGLYARELTLPKGTFVVGKIHRHAHLIQLLKGRATLVTENGPQDVVAPAMWTSQPGDKRVVYAHDDCVFVTFHPNDSQDLDVLEEQIIAPTYAALEHTV